MTEVQVQEVEKPKVAEPKKEEPLDELTLIRSVKGKLEKVSPVTAQRILNYVTSWNSERLGL